MRKRAIKIALIIVGLVSICLLCILSFPRELKKEEEIGGTEGYYTFDAQGILTFISQGETVIFTPITEAEADNLPEGQPMPWRQEDYYQVAQTFFRQEKGIDIRQWHLNDIMAHAYCKDLVDGVIRFRRMNFKFFQILGEKGKEKRISYFVLIEPGKGLLYINNIEYSPVVYRWDVFPLDQIKVPAEKALEIAEKNGGKQARLRKQNNCFIYTSTIDHWEVNYSNFFIVDIDESTGAYKVLRDIR